VTSSDAAKKAAHEVGGKYAEAIAAAGVEGGDRSRQSRGRDARTAFTQDHDQITEKLKKRSATRKDAIQQTKQAATDAATR